MRALLLSLLVIPGCYESHVRVDPERCAPDGAYTVVQTVTGAAPGCGVLGRVGELVVAIPPTPATFVGATTVDFTPLGPCTWAVHTETLIPDASSVVDGTIDWSDGTVRGSFEVTFSGFAGPVCSATLEWEERR